MSERMRFFNEGEPEPQTAEEWEAFMNDPERSRGYPGMLPAEGITAEQLLEQTSAVNTQSIVDSTALPETTPEPDDPPAEDTNPPTVVAAGPDKDARGVPPDTEIWVVFSEQVTEARMALKGPGGEPIAGMSRQESEDIAQFLPEKLLSVYTRYTVEVSGAKDAAGNVMPAPHSWCFTTGGPDIDPPTVDGTHPAEGETDVPVDTAVIVGFSEAVSGVQITVKDPLNATVQGMTASDTANPACARWTFIPASPFTASTAYRVEVSGAQDRSDNVMTPYTWSFTTAGDA
ncbi:Ig-like domain-containing protein [Nonomuraea fuscirosea]|uniref:Ig-like domain-containing protein n=1 Tax=Nonomuraea fuscirosea TaxID=1291556 RepID=UPI00342E4E5F